MTTNDLAPLQLPPFKEGEMKKVALGFREVDGKVEVTVTSHNMNDDINEIAVFLSFALEKMLED